ncbi:MAG: ECF transporter S component [Candidatus Bathyarchaeia archaeon]
MATLTIFTALYIALRFIPYSIIIGTSGGTLNLSDFLVPIIGILLGPYLGGLSVVIGNFAAIGMGKPMMFYGLDFLPDLMAVLATGFLTQQKRSRWAVVVALNAALLAIFLVNPLTSVFVFSFPFAWLHIVAFVVLLTPLSFMAAKWIYAINYRKVAAGIAVLSFIGVMMQHLAGSILFEVVLGQLVNLFPANTYPTTWSIVFFLYPVERTFLVISAVLVGTPLIYLFSKGALPKSKAEPLNREQDKTKST